MLTPFYSGDIVWKLDMLPGFHQYTWQPYPETANITTQSLSGVDSPFQYASGLTHGNSESRKRSSRANSPACKYI